MFRELKMLGQGTITAELFIAYANENNIFIKNLKIPRWIDSPVY